MTQPIRPLFLFSLPRAGSTLVQRIISAHPQIATVSEPWLLLHQLYVFRSSGLYAEYAHDCVVMATEDFCLQLPGGRADYLAEVRKMVLNLYRKAAGDEATYFLDKTPRYHFVAQEIMEMFPDARFVFLWRNPLAVVGSIVETWQRGKWKLHEYGIDLFGGVERLCEAFDQRGDNSIALRYEDLLAEPDTHWPKLFEFLELDYQPHILTDFAQVPLHGRLGDPTGSKQYKALSAEPLTKWCASVSTPYRKAWCRRYLNWIGRQRLATMGYDLDTLLAEVRACPVSVNYMRNDISQWYKHGLPPAPGTPAHKVRRR